MKDLRASGVMEIKKLLHMEWVIIIKHTIVMKCVYPFNY